jgi:DNA-binding transcriptional MerR regulator
MRIGEVTARTGIPQRMLRYYEEQGLLSSERADNGYREYDHDAVERAQRVRGLIQAGLSTRMVKVVLDLEADCRATQPPSCTRGLAEELAAELHALDDRLACLAKSRDAVALYLSRSPHADLLSH